MTPQARRGYLEDTADWYRARQVVATIECNAHEWRLCREALACLRAAIREAMDECDRVERERWEHAN